MALANLLGDVRAEFDKRMLSEAFYESPDYRTLVETTDRALVVGRRGTGKSALALKLSDYWSSAERTAVTTVTAQEDQIIGLRPLIQMFGNTFRLVRAGSRTAWKYALLLEIGCVLISQYKIDKMEKFELLKEHTGRWKSLDNSICGRLRTLLTLNLDKQAPPETIIGDLAKKLQLRDIENAIESALDVTKYSAILLIDKLDEGYEPDDIGIGLIDGLVHAAVDINSQIQNVRVTAFLRDNMFRAIAKSDPDFSRDIENQTLRLHWDEYNLFNLATLRIQKALSVEKESSIKIWNRCTAGGLEGKEGFRLCLRNTLYRPRDVLTLLNEAFLHANHAGRDRIVANDIDVTSKSISEHRLNDLKKEYTAISPGLDALIGAFAGKPSQQDLQTAERLIAGVLASDTHPQEIQQQLAIVNDPRDAIKDLYGVGLLGIRDDSTGDFVFCHDGRKVTKTLNGSTVLLVHPCYWSALGVTHEALDEGIAQQIYDEYDIEVSSENPAQRAKRLGHLIADLDNILEGKSGASAFEEWCLEAIKIVFAGGLRNVQLHPNGGGALQRRDILGTNLGETRAWKRVLEDYKSRQVIFEVKNYEKLTGDDFRQVLSYLTGEYGKAAFFVTRGKDHELRGDSGELEWMKEMHRNHNVLIVKLTGRLLAGFLGKLRNPQKHDHADKALLSILDTYTRVYLSATSRVSKKYRRRR